MTTDWRRDMPEDLRRHAHVLAVMALGILALCFPALAQAPLDIRVALVIGNSAYPGAPLLNPANDARAMSDTLRGLGFTVVQLRDGQKDQMADAIATVRDILKGKQGIGMLYYAGHGLQLDWRNYLVPVDAKLASASDVAAQTIDVNSVLEAFKAAGTRMNILVLDACRDNPFAGTASGKGLAQLDAPPRTILAFATAPGNVAEDGDVNGGNGLYTQFLLEELKKPSTKIEDVFKRVRLQVRQKSLGRQIPWESTSLEDDFFFNTGKIVAQPSIEQRLKAAQAPGQKADWERIQNSTLVADYYAYLLRYPSGGYSELAQAAVQRLQKAQVAAVPNQQGLVQAEGGPRFRVGDTITWAVLNPYRGDAQVGTLRETVTSIQSDRVETSSGAIYTPEGWTIVSRHQVQHSPPSQVMPVGDYQVGKKWEFRGSRAANVSQRNPHVGTATIAALEDVIVPAGTFKAYRVEIELDATFGGHTATYWMEPGWGFPIKVAFRKYRDYTPTTAYAPDALVMVSRQRGPG